MNSSLSKSSGFLITLLLLSACNNQPTQTAQPQAQTLPIIEATQQQSSPVSVTPSIPATLSPKPGPSGQFSLTGDQVKLGIKLPPLPGFQSQALDFAGANQITATLIDSSGHSYTPDGATSGQVAYPSNGELNLTFSGVRPDELLIAELKVQTDLVDLPQANLAGALSSRSLNNASGEISFRTTPTALVAKGLLTPSVDKARALNLGLLQTFVNTITGASGSGTSTTYGQIHPTLVKIADLTTALNAKTIPQLSADPAGGLSAAAYRFVGATADITVSGLVSTDRVRLQLTDAASAVVTSAGNGLVSLPKSTPGSGLLLKASSVATPGTSYTFTATPSNISLTENNAQAISLVAVPATPTLASLSPTSAKAGDTLTLTGTNFHKQLAGNKVSFGGVEVDPATVNIDATSMTVIVPSGLSAGSVNIQTKVGSVSSGAQALNVLPSTTITGLNIGNGKSGDTVIITGTSLTGATAVTFNGRAAASYTVNSDTQITAVVPYGPVTTGKVSVTAADTAQSGSDFTINQRIWLVNDDAPGNNSGTNWANAYKDLQTTLHATTGATSGDEIWAAAGKYTPIVPKASPNATERAVSFVLKAGVSVYGGFAGNETQRSARNVNTNVTTLSGDIDNVIDVYDMDIAGGITHTGIDGNSYQVVRGVTGAILDGFTIQGGNANGSSSLDFGGGMYNNGSSPNLANIVISGNSANNNGGGMFNTASSPNLTNIVISGNSSNTSGGGMSNSGGSPTLTNVIISGNSATGIGGGMYNNVSSPTLTNVIISANSATGLAGGIYNNSGSSKLINVTLSSNTSPSFGQGIYNAGGTVVLANVLFWNNTVHNLTIPSGQGNVTAASDPFVNSTAPAGPDGKWFTADDGLQLKSTSIPVIDKGISQSEANALSLGITVPVLDILGATRPFGAKPDPGAYEIQSEPALTAGSGFTINGVALSDASGVSVSSAGDINKDGFADLIIGAYQAGSNAGASYVVYGSATLGSSGTLELSTLDGFNGFKLNGAAAGEYSGYSVSGAGDLNKDGFDDLIIGAYAASTPNGTESGASYVVYGSASLGTGGTLQLSSLNGSNGFRINGAAASHLSGNSVSGAGDLNKDGFADLIIGAYGANPNGKNRAGSSYVVYGSATLGTGGTIDLSTLNGSNGFRLNGTTADDYSGYSVSNAGDLNNDGFDDLVIGAFLSSPNGRPYSGSTFVVYGSASLGSGGTLELSTLNGSNGFRLNGVAASDYTGVSVSGAGDLNKDGFADLIIGAYQASPNGISLAGSSYVVYGSASLGSGGTLEFSSLNGSNGFRLNGTAAGENSGYSVSGAGDLNKDGFADLIIGAYRAGSNAGASYVVYGSPTLGSSGTLELSTLNGSNGFKLNGITANNLSGNSVSGAGDLNKDGFADLIIGARAASPNGRSLTGSSYVVFGTSAAFPANINLGSLVTPTY